MEDPVATITVRDLVTDLPHPEEGYVVGTLVCEALKQGTVLLDFQEAFGITPSFATNLFRAVFEFHHVEYVRQHLSFRFQNNLQRKIFRDILSQLLTYQVGDDE